MRVTQIVCRRWIPLSKRRRVEEPSFAGSNCTSQKEEPAVVDCGEDPFSTSPSAHTLPETAGLPPIVPAQPHRVGVTVGFLSDPMRLKAKEDHPFSLFIETTPSSLRPCIVSAAGIRCSSHIFCIKLPLLTQRPSMRDKITLKV
jgi:hypothetical protein